MVPAVHTQKDQFNPVYRLDMLYLVLYICIELHAVTIGTSTHVNRPASPSSPQALLSNHISREKRLEQEQHLSAAGV